MPQLQVHPPRARYGGTLAPCDDPAPCEVSDRTGFRVATRLGPSTIAGAGLGRFAAAGCSCGTVLREQRVGTANLPAYRSAQELCAAFPAAEDLPMLADFAFSSPSHPGAVLLDSPPTMVNHANDAAGANTAFRFEGDAKSVVATRDIEEGDELLQDYRAIARVGWLEALLASADLQTARQLGVQIEAAAAAGQRSNAAI